MHSFVNQPKQLVHRCDAVAPYVMQLYPCNIHIPSCRGRNWQMRRLNSLKIANHPAAFTLKHARSCMFEEGGTGVVQRRHTPIGRASWGHLHPSNTEISGCFAASQRRGGRGAALGRPALGTHVRYDAALCPAAPSRLRRAPGVLTSIDSATRWYQNTLGSPRHRGRWLAQAARPI